MDNPRIDKDGTKGWYNANSEYHRDDGPAIEDTYGYQSWYQHGKTHRDDGPAVEWSDGDKAWYQHGKVHRTDGPAVEYANGENYWYLNDKRLSFDEWLHTVNMSDEDKVMMKLQYG
jgi:hypothetical protein